MPSRHDFLGLLVSRLQRHYPRVSWGQDLQETPGGEAVLVELLADADATDSNNSTGQTQLSLAFTVAAEPVPGRREGVAVELAAAQAADKIYHLVVEDGLGLNGPTIKVQAQSNAWQMDYLWGAQGERTPQLTATYWLNLAAAPPAPAEED